jgi:hypothetical protein
MFLSAQSVMGVTTAQYFGMQGMINIANHTGQTDADARTLMADMNVPIQGSVMGPGKAITNEGKILNYICADRGSGNFSCTVIIQKSPHSKLSPQRIAYEVFGEQAQGLHEKFHPNQGDGSYQFTSIDGLFQVISTNDHFLVEYQQ